MIMFWVVKSTCQRAMLLDTWFKISSCGPTGKYIIVQTFLHCSSPVLFQSQIFCFMDMYWNSGGTFLNVCG
jgi:hypothetical protein